MPQVQPQIKIACSREGVFFLFFAVGLGLAAIYTAKNALILLFCFLLFTIAGTLFLGRRNVMKLDIARRFGSEIFAGQESHIDVLTRNTGRYSSYALRIYEDFEQDRTIGPIFIPSLKANETAQSVYDCVFPVRGSMRFRQIQVRSRFPLPFFEFRCIYKLEDRHIIYPARDSSRDMIHFGALDTTNAGRCREHISVFQELEHGHQRGRILWKLSAKRGEFIEEVKKHGRAESASAIEIIPKNAMSAQDYEKQISQIADYCIEAMDNGQSVTLCHQNQTIQSYKRHETLEYLATI